MQLEQYANNLREQLAIAAEAGGEEARALAQRLTAPLDSAIQLMLLNVLAAAAAEITRELAPGSVELRLRGSEPEFVVTAPPAEREPAAERGIGEPRGPGEAWAGGDPPPTSAGAGEGGVSRVNLRLPDQLKSRIEHAAEREGLSVNAWLVRAAAVAVERGETGRRPDTPKGGQQYTGWGR